jgi:hypothetical protein
VKLPHAIAALPIGHLQLEGRAATAAAAHGTIGVLAHAINDRSQFRARASGTLQIQRVLQLLAAAIQSEGTAGWDRFRKTRPPFVRPEAVYFYSPKLDALAPAARDGSLARIHLSRRAITALSAGGLSNIGAFVRGAQQGIVHLRAIGHLTTVELTETLDALADSLTPENNIDWLAYADRRRFRILPESDQTCYTGREFLWYFPKTCEIAVSSKFGPAARLLLQRRMFRHPDIAVSLTDIAPHLGLTKERVRLLEQSILKMLRRAIWSDEYRGCRFRFRQQFLQPLRDLAARVRATPEGTLSSARWRILLRATWGVEPSELGQQSALLSQLLDLQTELREGPPTVTDAAGREKAIGKALHEISLFFGARGAEACSADEVGQHLRACLADEAPDDDTLLKILQSLPMLELEKTRRHYRVRLEHLKHHGDRCERILRDRGMTMHFREIYAEIARVAPRAVDGLTPRDLASRMASAGGLCRLDERASGVFAIGRTCNGDDRRYCSGTSRQLGDSAGRERSV